MQSLDNWECHRQNFHQGRTRSSSIVVLSDQNGKTVSMSAWTKGVPTLLPKSDRIVLVEPVEGGEPTVKTVLWSEFESELGDLLTTETGYPPRYRTLGFPSARAHIL
jgi:hypothetical protein